MGTATMVFLIIGGLGVGALALALFGAEMLHFGHPDLDGPVSLEVAAGFLGAFGFAGAAANELLPGGSAAVATLAAAGVGIAAAVPTAYLAFRLARAARTMHTDATPTRADLVGTLGVVVTPIAVDGYGEVRVRLGGQPVKLYARSESALPTGTHIFVVEAPTDTSVIVERTEPIGP